MSGLLEVLHVCKMAWFIGQLKGGRDHRPGDRIDDRDQRANPACQRHATKRCAQRAQRPSASRRRPHLQTPIIGRVARLGE